MQELKEVRFNETEVLLKDSRVKSPILPEKRDQMNRTVTIQGNAVIEGAVYAQRLAIQTGDAEFMGAVFANLELHVNTDATGKIIFRKSVGSADSVVSRASNANLLFANDINAKKVTLYNAFVAGSIYADDIVLENCVVIGGVFATQKIDMKDSIVGTFNGASVSVSSFAGILLPSAFSIEKLYATPDIKFYNYSLADFGALFKGQPQSQKSGKIKMNIEAVEIKTTLSTEEYQKTLLSYTVIGKVLAADLLDTDRFQNHFLLTAASLNSQLLRVYDFGRDAKGNPIELSLEKIKDFFFDVLHGKIEVQDMDGNFDIKQLTKEFN
ncbi:MAG: hypothetical protein FWC26_13250 [Fibromonadales bacterium]|nr:hypothetical protein [Fibromonadales bacterium]